MPSVAVRKAVGFGLVALVAASVLHGTDKGKWVSSRDHAPLSRQAAAAAGPDLKVDPFPENVTIYNWTSVGSFRVTNIGTVATPVTKLSFTCQKMNPAPPNLLYDVRCPVGSADVKALQPGEGQTIKGPFDPVVAVPQRIRLFAIVDRSNLIKERNEKNNSASWDWIP